MSGTEIIACFPKTRPDGWVYVEGMCRNDTNNVVSHIYCGPSFGDLNGPLCARGWNRDDGNGFSIFRGNTSGAGTCRVCYRRKAKNMGPVPPKPRKTKWA